jgi:uncharacterized protein YwqG
MERLESMVHARDTEHVCIGYATEMRAQLPLRVRPLAEVSSSGIDLARDFESVRERSCETHGVDLTEYATRADSVGLGPFVDALTRAAQPSIRLRPSLEDEGAGIGASRLGDLPDLPIEAEWPRNDDEPLSFIAQINLQDIRAYDQDDVLPADGRLSFFYDAVGQSAWGFSPADQGSSAILYIPPASPLVRREAPSGLEPSGVFRPVPLVPEAELTFVPWESFTAEAIGMSQAQALEYAEICDGAWAAGSRAGRGEAAAVRSADRAGGEQPSGVPYRGHQPEDRDTLAAGAHNHPSGWAEAALSGL